MPSPPPSAVRALVHLYSPPYLLSALAALASLYPGARVEATLVVQLPLASDETLAEMVGVVRELSTGHPAVARVEGLSDADIAALDGQGLRARLGAGFQDFLYSHDSTGQVCRRLAHAYPAARKVCIGDGFGMMYAADFIARYHAPRPLRARVAGWLRGDLPQLVPDLAALVLPVDPSGEALDRLDLVVCRAEDFRGAVRHCHDRAHGLRAYMADILNKYAERRRYLLLTETYMDSGHVRAERETDMYAEIVRRHCEPGSAVLVKLHPMQPAGASARLQAALGGTHEIVETEPRFRRYPVEIWEELARGCTVVSTAYPVLSLKYALGIDVVQPMDEAFIARWIEPEHQAWVRDGLRLYMEPLARLARWDGRSVLWSGKAVH
jgi:hypothetical protein